MRRNLRYAVGILLTGAAFSYYLFIRADEDGLPPYEDIYNDTLKQSEPPKIAKVPVPATPPKLPLKWGRPTISWQSQVIMLEPINAFPILAKPSTADEQAKMPTPAPLPRPSTAAKNLRGAAAEKKPKRVRKTPQDNFATARVAPALFTTGRRSSATEKSETKGPTATPPATIPSTGPVQSIPPWTPTTVPFAASPRRWPPAYATGEPVSTPSASVIPLQALPPPPPPPPPPPKPAPAATERFRPPAPISLEDQIKAICGWQAREVAIDMLTNDIVLVRVKVRSFAARDQLSRAIMSLPEMNSVNVRLQIDVRP